MLNEYNLSVPIQLEQYIIDELKSSSIANFKHEINIQTEIYLKTMQYLEPVCPAIVHALTSINLNLLNPEDNDTALILNQFKNMDVDSIGIIAMEFASGFKTLYNYTDSALDDSIKLIFIAMAAFIVIRLAIETEYTQADFHARNIMINRLQNGYFKNTQGQPMILDFGLARKIPTNKMNKIRDYFKQHKYKKILKIIHSVNRSDDYELDDSPPHYGYLNGTYDIINYKKTKKFPSGFNELIDKLFMEYNETINERTSQSNIPNQSIPRLPLSNRFKDNLYSGMEDIAPLIKVDLNFENQSQINIRIFKILIDWIFNISKKRNKIKIFIKACYDLVYIINNHNDILRPNIQLMGCVVMYYNSFLEDLIYDQDLEYYVTLTDNAYTIKEFQAEISKWKILPTLNIDNITSYMDLNKFKIMSKDEIVEFMINPEVYSNPSSFSQMAEQSGGRKKRGTKRKQTKHVKY